MRSQSKHFYKQSVVYTHIYSVYNDGVSASRMYFCPRIGGIREGVFFEGYRPIALSLASDICVLPSLLVSPPFLPSVHYYYSLFLTEAKNYSLVFQLLRPAT